MNTIVFVGSQSQSLDTKWHKHENWELIYCKSGESEVRFQDGRTMPYHAGDLVVLPPDEMHINPAGERLSKIHLNISDPSFPYRSAFKVQDENGSLFRAFEEAVIYYISDKSKRELVLAALGDLIISYIIVLRSNSEFSLSVEQIRNSILRNYTDSNFALDEFIRTLPFHYDYLRKIFKKEMGMSPLEYMTSLRMKNAERLLSTVWKSGYSIGEIAQQCGFDNALYFSRVFRKYYGCSPSQFIKNQQKEPADCE